MQQQAGPAPTMMPTMPQTPALPRDPTEYTQANFPSLTPTKTAGRVGSAGDAGSASTAQQRTQHPTGWPSDRNRGTCAKHRHGLHTAHQHRTTSFGDRTGDTAPPSFSHAQHHEGRDRRAVCPAKTAQEPFAATAPTSPQVQKPSAIRQAPTKEPSDQIPKPPQPGPSLHPPQPPNLASCQYQTCSWMKSG